MSLTLTSLQLLLASVLVYAAVAKAFSTDAFRTTLVTSGVRDRLVEALAWGIPALEFLLAVVLLLGSSTPLVVAFTATAGLLAGFALWVLVVLVRGLNVSCACFGRSARSVNLAMLVRNLVLASGALVGTYLSLTTRTVIAATVSLSSVVATTSAIAAGVLLTAAAVVRTDLVLSTRDERLNAGRLG